MKWCSRVLCATLVAMIVHVPGAFAQSSLAVADAKNFMGKWSVAMDTPQGAFTLNVNLSDKGGKVAGEVSADVMPSQEITDITKAGQDLVLKYSSEVQGQAFNVKITMSLSGADAGKAVFDAADGMF